MAQGSDPYNTYGGVPKTAPQGMEIGYSRAQATPKAAGIDVFKATEKLGGTVSAVGQDIVKEEVEAYDRMADARASDRYANEWAPEAARKRLAFQTLRGPDKVAGYQAYVADLAKFRNQMLEGAKTEREKMNLGNLLNDRLASETESAGRELDGALLTYENEALGYQLFADAQVAASDPNNIEEVRKARDRVDALIDLRAVNNGLNPEDPEVSRALSVEKQQVQGQISVNIVGKLLNSGDLNGANNVYHANLARIPIHQQLAIDQALGTESLRQNSKNTVDALVQGRPFPNSVGAPPIQVRATVAQAAAYAGIDPSAALTVLRIESADGQNVGKRGTIGQDKATAGQPMEAQAQALVTNFSEARNTATAALGRTAEDWESYVVYQQGVGGGPALFRSAKSDPDQRAVDALRPFYKSAAVAEEAITGNGGNVTMTSGQFIESLRQKYLMNEKYAKVTAENPSTIGKDMLKPYETQTVTVQPGPTPWQNLQNLDAALQKKKDYVLSLALPDADKKDAIATMEMYRGSTAAAAERYRAEIEGQAARLAGDKDFVSVDQIPIEMRAAIDADFPKLYTDLRTAAAANRGALSDPVVVGGYEARIDEVFRPGTTSLDAKIKSGKSIKDAADLQEDIQRDMDAGRVSAESGNAMIKNIQVQMADVGAAGNLGKDNHYADAFREFKDSGANAADVNAMFRDYVKISNKVGLDNQQDRAWYRPESKEQKNSVDSKTLTQAILNRVANKKYAGMVMLQSPPNAAVGASGESMVISSAKPEGKADTKVTTGFKIMVDAAGNRARVYDNGTIEEIQ